MINLRGSAAKVAWFAAILLVSASAGVFVDWNAPGVSRYAPDWLMRKGGPLTGPDDIAIVAIDEASIARFGRFPWSRHVMARAIDALAAAHPKAIALDVLFSDPTSQEDDEMLAHSIGRAGNVVVAAQLSTPSKWLLPLPAIERAAAGVGHVNVQTAQDGTAREIAARLADASGHTFLAMPLEAVRIADGTPPENVTDTPNALLLGQRAVMPVAPEPGLHTEPQQSTQWLHSGRIAIDYVGPAGSFAPVTWPLADVLAGRVPADKFRGKLVLIGATAA